MKLRARSINSSSSGSLVGFGNHQTMVNLSVLTVRISQKGRLIAVHHNGRVLHHRDQRGQGGKCFRLPSKKLAQFRNAAVRVIAARALGMQFAQLPPFEFDL